MRTLSLLRGARLLPRNDYLGWTPYAWLIYLPAIFVQPVIDRSLAEGMLAALGGLIFLYTYFRAYWVRDRELLPLIVIQMALAAGLTPINHGAYVLFIYAASFAARLEETASAIRWIAIVYVTGLVAAWLTDAPIYYWFGHGVFTPFIAGISLHFARVNRANLRLRLADEEIKHLAAVAERERIARDLHDVLGHTLSLIVLKSELASKLAERDPARAIGEIRDVEQVARTALRDVRDAIRGYRPTLSDEISRARAFLDAAHIAAEVDIGDVGLPSTGEEVIALALREAVTNIVRHSGASRARIRVWRADETAMLEVTDDGRGATSIEGAGLRGMRERVEQLGGRMNRGVENGMCLTIALPLQEAAAR